jgi:hypothetical protein
MAEVDSATLIVAIQSLELSIRHHDKMLKAQVLGDRSDVEEYLLVLENAKAALREAFAEERKQNPSLPDYASLLDIELI